MADDEPDVAMDEAVDDANEQEGAAMEIDPGPRSADDEAFLQALRARAGNEQSAEEEAPGARFAAAEIAERVASYRNLPPIKNDEGFDVAFGRQPTGRNGLRQLLSGVRGEEDPSLSVYCGRNLGRQAIPRSDGRCGPDNGPQCASCKRLQRGPGRVELMGRKFPGLPREAFVGALRERGGMMAPAIKYLRDGVGAKDCEVRSGLALISPTALRDGGGDGARRAPPVADPDEAQVATLMETFQVERPQADIALRRNGNDAERAAAWLLDTAPQEIEEAVREWDEEMAARAGEMGVLRENQATEVERALKSGVPEKILDLAKNASLSVRDRVGEMSCDPWIWKKDGNAAVTEEQHFMTRVASSSHCFHCAATLPIGSYCCELCRLCEGCVLGTAVDVCPRLFNGGHLHPHALTYDQDKARRGTSCDIGLGKEHCQDNSCCWTCEECDFDTCYECIKRSKPVGYDRLAGTVVNPEDGSTEVTNGSLFPAFDASLCERGAAARWEGNYIEDAEVDVIAGTGDVESATPPSDPQRTRAPTISGNRRGGRLLQRNANFHRSPTLMTETKLSDEAEYALCCFKDPKRLDSSTDDVVAAADITQAENILERLRVVDDKATLRAVCEAIASGRLDIGGALLLSEAFAPVPVDASTPEGEQDGEEEQSDNGQGNGARRNMVCLCCHGDIDLESAPDGAVGCLSGHAMHPCCASDLLLGGGRCPACSIPLFYAKIPQAEANAAAKIAAVELARIKENEMDKRMLLQVNDATIEKGDIVRVASDEDRCKEAQTDNPLSGGWNSDLVDHCGEEFCVTGIVKDQIQARRLLQQSHSLVPMRQAGHQCVRCNMRGPSIQTGGSKCKACSLCHRCCLKSYNVCDSGGRCLAWDPSLVTLVRKAGSAPIAEEACIDREELLAQDAQNHLTRLKAELAAVKSARENTKALLHWRPDSVSRELTPQGEEAILYVSDKISPADWYRAKHLLLLARLWGDSDEAKRLRAQLYSLVREGSLDSVARIVRRYNAAQTIQGAKWSDAAATTHEYVINPDVQVQLFAFPSRSAPKTGFSIGPKTRFTSKKEIVDCDGVLWLQVSPDSFFDQTRVNGDVRCDESSASSIVGARVVRGSSWNWGDQDGGRGTKGTIVAAKKSGSVVVEWDGSPRLYNYPASANSQTLSFAPAIPPPQGWACFRPQGPKSPSIAKLSRSPFRCFGCGDGLVSPRASSQTFELAQNIKAGDELYVAATMEAVKVESVSPGQVYCSFSALEDESGDKKMYQDESFIWYRPDDLLSRCEHAGKDTVDDDIRVIDGLPRTRRELVLLCGDVEKARLEWSKSSEEDRNIAAREDCGFASCARGHLLHARCLQGALLSGGNCPCVGCHEPLYLPQIQIQQDETTCCSAHEGDGEEVETLEAVAEVSAHTTGASTDIEGHEFASAGIRGLRMCPSCCAGPLMNTECSDMRAHHGQCTVYALGGGDDQSPCGPGGAFRAAESDMVAALMKLGDDQSVADLLPKCPTHDVVVMFNGCMSCGYLFTSTSWNEMPQYDPKAKSLLELDKKKRKAAMLLAEQIRSESTMLEFERSALWKLQEDERLLSGVAGSTGTKKKDMEPPQIPAVPAYEVNLHEPQNYVQRHTNTIDIADLLFGAEDAADY